MSEEIRIYVAYLAAYNNGTLHGMWIDATQELNDIQDQINEMLKASPIEEEAEEYAIHNFEGVGNYSVGEFSGIEELHEIACFIEEYPEIGSEVLGHFGDDLDDARKAIEENYSGCYSSLADYAQELTESTSEIPKHLEFYIDYERMGRDMEYFGDVFTIEQHTMKCISSWNH